MGLTPLFLVGLAAKLADVRSEHARAIGISTGADRVLSGIEGFPARSLRYGSKSWDPDKGPGAIAAYAACPNLAVKTNARSLSYSCARNAGGCGTNSAFIRLPPAQADLHQLATHASSHANPRSFEMGVRFLRMRVMARRQAPPAWGRVLLPLANRQRRRRRCRVVFLVLSEDRLESFLRPEFRRADCAQAGGVPIQADP